MLEALLALADNIGLDAQVKPVKSGYIMINRKRGLFSATKGDLSELELQYVINKAFQLRLSGPLVIRDLVLDHARKLGAGEQFGSALRAGSGNDLQLYQVPENSHLMCRPCGQVHGVTTLTLASHKFHVCLNQLKVVGVEASVIPTREGFVQE